MSPELELLRPALEMAFVVARQGESAPARIDAPRGLRRFLRFSRLPPPALAAARTVLDEDDGFRRRVADRSDEEEVGHAGWLWLTRPDGWRDELDELVRERVEAGEEVEARSAHRRLAEAEATIRDQQREIEAQRRELKRAGQRVDARDDADRRHTEHVADLESRIDAMADERARAVRELKAMERRLADRTAQLREAERRGDEAEVPAPPGLDPADLALAGQLADEVRRRWAETELAVDRLTDLVDELIRGVDGDAATPLPSPSRRRALRLGRGLVDGSTAAARWLLARSGAVVLVDGYNVTMLAWPELGVTDQRDALERSVTALQSQTGARFVLVFDGDDAGGAAVRSGVGSPLRVRFTHRDTEADDEILRLVDGSTDPVVVVVSNDRRVLDGAEARGANTIRSTEFVQLILG